MKFCEFDLPDRLIQAIHSLGYQTATKVQSKSLEYSLTEKDLLCLSETGSGKTLSFIIPILTHLLSASEAQN